MFIAIVGNVFSNYPWQTCSNICGVVVIIMANIVAKNWEFFLQIAQNVANSNFKYLRDPTKYSKYLRLVLMS